jgi:hypothetical protein
MYKINIISGDCKGRWTEQLLRIKDTRISKSTGQKKCKTKEERPKRIKQGTSLKWLLTCC